MKVALKIWRYDATTGDKALREYEFDAPDEATLLDCLDIVKDRHDGSLPACDPPAHVERIGALVGRPRRRAIDCLNAEAPGIVGRPDIWEPLMDADPDRRRYELLYEDDRMDAWVLSWMPDVRVLAPKSLRDRITLKLTDGLRRNTENEDGPNQMLHTNREQARDR